MSAAIIILIIAFVILLAAIGVGLYFAFRKTSDTNDLQPLQPATGSTGGFLPLQPTTGNTGGFLPLQPANGSTGPTGGFLPLVPSGPCGQDILNVLAAQYTSGSTGPYPNLAARSLTATNSEGCGVDIYQKWLVSNALIYSYITNNLNVTPTTLSQNYNSIMSPIYPGGITNNQQAYSDSLWAIRAIPTNSAQLTDFNRFWNNQGIPPSLKPKFAKPILYPPANYTPN